MAFDYIGVGISIVIISFYLAILFFLTEIKRRVDGEIGEVTVYATLAIITLILLRIQTILSKADLLNIPYSQEVLALMLALFIFMAIFTLYKGVMKITDKKTSKNKRASKRKVKVSFIPARNFSNQAGNVKIQKRNLSDGYIDLTK